MKGMGPMAGVISVAGLLVLACTGTAQAAMTTSVEGNTLAIFSNDEGEVNLLSMFINDDGLVLEDGEAGVAAGACMVSGATILVSSCFSQFPDGAPERIRIETSGGIDSFSAPDARLIGLGDELGIEVRTGEGADGVFTLLGGEYNLGPGNDGIRAFIGRDRIDGGPGNDLLEGGGSDDVLEGGSGNDRIFGGLEDPEPIIGRSDGRDKLLGGSGKDKLFARDFTMDRKLDCGGGKDRVKRDRFDPRPKSC